MKSQLRKTIVIAFTYLGFIQIQAQEENDFIGDWYYIGGVDHMYPELNEKIPTTNENKTRLRIPDHSNIQIIQNNEMVNQAYINGHNEIVKRYDSGGLRGKISIRNDTLIMRNKQTGLCPSWDYSIYFKREE